MKKLLFTILSFLLVFSSLNINAQPMGTLWGVAGGGPGTGVIYNYNVQSNQENIAASFNNDYPNGGLVQAFDGNMYGLTNGANGGTNANGDIFMYNTKTGVETDLYDFTGGTDGKNAYGHLVVGSDSNLYGMSFYGGTNGDGNIFCYNIRTHTFSVVWSFNGTDGNYIFGSLIKCNDGNLYGMTVYGGGNGNIIEYNMTTKTVSVIHNFNGTDGSAPYADLVQGADGNLYGMTQNGGTFGKGNIFKCSLTGTCTSIYSFTGGNDGANPFGTLIQANDGLLYGMTQQGGANSFGVLFKCTTSGTYSLLHTFTGSSTDGEYPAGSLLQANDGNLYGVTSEGGASTYGTIFQYNTIEDTTNTIFSFNYNDGYSPSGSLLEALANKLAVSDSDCNNRTLTAEVTGGTHPITYMWSTGATTSTLTANTAGTYWVAVSDAKGATVRDTVVLKSNYTALVNNISGLNSVCPGSSNGYAVAQVTGGSGPYTYYWNNGNTTDSIGGLSVGNDTLWVMDSTGCTWVGVYTVSQNSKPTVVTTASSAAVCPGTADTLNAVETLNENGLIAYYPFDGNANDLSGNGLNATAVGVTPATDRFGNPNSCYQFSGAGTYVQCPAGNYFTGGDFTISAWVNGSTFETWSRVMDFGNGPNADNVNFILSDPSNTLAFDILNGGADAGAISSNHTLPLNQWIQVALTFNANGQNFVMYLNGDSIAAGTTTYAPNNVNRNNNYIGKSNWSGDGGVYGYMDDIRIYSRALSKKEMNKLYSNESVSEGNYSWAGVANTQQVVVKPVVGETYTVTVTNEDGCTNTATQAVNINPVPSLSIVGNTTCANTDADITVKVGPTGGPYTYAWSTGGTSYTIDVPASSTPTYSVVVKNSYGCKDSIENIKVTVNPLPTINVTGKDSVVAGNKDTLTAGGTSGVSYTWSTGSTSDTTIVSPSTQTTYTVTGTDGNGCTNTATFTVKVEIMTGINALSASNSATLYPNPATETVNLVFAAQSNETATLSVIDMMGRKLMSQSITISNGKALPINISNLSQGTYFVKISTDKTTQVVRFVKQ